MQHLAKAWVLREEWVDDWCWDVAKDSGPTQRHFHLTRHTVSNGLIMFEISMALMSLGVVCAREGAMKGIMHLYNAAKHEYNVRDWPDMEYLIDYHGSSHLFVGERPSKLWQYSKRYLASLGINARALSLTAGFEHRGVKGFRPTGNSAIADGRIRSCQQDVLCSLVLSRYMCRMDSLEQPCLAKVFTAFGTSLKVEHFSFEVLRSRSAIQLLDLVRHGIEVDTEHIMFNYMAMMQRCVTLCSVLVARLREDLESARFWLRSHHEYPLEEELDYRQAYYLILKVLQHDGEERFKLLKLACQYID
ncbi:hypothetical protein BDV96DRAFT_264498 [Lophiotrema nucula]|uniref:Uncharacterized protein n=1 Tax=Lophiotrema nucula TaxID=690887 RepID=A0A6A5YNS6_9PLEO|nr:hypothetical protein BDV96DRAFT_264498 [Lophiotrema nucula]